MLNTINKVGFDLQDTLLQGFTIFGLSHTLSAWLLVLITVGGISLLSYIGFFITKYCLNGFLEKFITARIHSTWIKLLFEYQVIARLTHLVPAILVYSCSPLISLAPTLFSLKIAKIYKTFALAYILVTLYRASCAFLDAIEGHYRNFKLANRQSIKGYFQTLKIILFVLTSILVIADFMNKSPVYLLTSIGALATLLLLAFKDLLLGLVANIQIATGDLIRLGDSIQVDQYGIKGEVVDISLSQIKIQNQDKSVTTIPTYLLMSVGLKNLRTAQEAEGKLIKRTFNIDITTIKFCGDFLLNNLYQKNIISQSQLTQYLQRTINNTNKTNYPTNLEVLREYLQHYLSTHVHVQASMPLTVRQQQGTSTGLPLELYFFINDQNAIQYEIIQSSIFEHVYAILKEFELRAFQYISAASFQAESTSTAIKAITSTAAFAD